MTFRYSIEPHSSFDSAKAAKFGTEQSQPLIAVPVDKKTPIPDSIMKIEPASIIVTAFKPNSDGKAWIIRLFNVSGQSQKVNITWTKSVPEAIWLSNMAEEEVSKLTGPIEMAAYDIVTLKASLPEK